MEQNDQIAHAAQMIQNADALLIGAGAGMGVDSGLPDFRGNEGLWKAYPPLQGIPFEKLATPDLFITNPRRAWGFYGHRLNLYRQVEPHKGYDILQKWIQSKEESSFVFTSNVDGHFLRQGFEAHLIEECHGSIHHLQCVNNCQNDLWSADSTQVKIDLNSFELVSDFPRCPHCQALARPNILMFGDWGWNRDRTAAQSKRFVEWRRKHFDNKIVSIEIGAGTAIPSVRYQCEVYPSIRINPRQYFPAKKGDLGLQGGALEILEAIDRLMQFAVG